MDERQLGLGFENKNIGKLGYKEDLMKVLLFHDGLGSGGAERQLVELTKGLKARGYDAKILIYRKAYHYLYELERNGIPLIEIKKNGKIDFKFIFYLIKIIKKENPDFIISFKTIPNIWILFVSKIINYKNLVISERNIDIQYHKIMAMIEKWLSSNAKYIIANTYTAKDILVEKYKFSEKKVIVINNGVDIDRFLNINKDKLESYRDSLRIRKNSINIGLIGRIAKQKNHVLAIEALHRLLEIDSSQDIMLYCFGKVMDYKLYDKLLELIEKYKLGNNVSFHKPMKEIEYVYHLMDIIILPSLYEGFSNVILEAMCCSKIIIASDVSDNKKIIDDDIDGFIFKNNNLESFLEKIKYVLNLETKSRDIIGKRAYKKIIDNYSIDVMVEKYVKVLLSKKINIG